MRLALVPLAILAVALTTRAGDDFKPEPGYVSLFNGKDLAGWKYGKETDLAGKTETADKRFRVADGIIVAEEGKGIKDLYTVKAFNTEFNLKLEFRAALKADSGVYIRGPQLQVRDFIRRGEMKGKLTKFKNDGWNELDITVKNGVVTTTVNGKALTEKDSLALSVENGKPIAMLNGKSVDINKIECSVGAVARCLCNGELMENMKIPQKSGQGIGLQAETGKFEFRRIRVKEMP
ncbi:MAG: DUF1080 domain-containing protein [Planctomycetes bacterium]|nr:DUF1080 domain-containing protein [Planctomycetota bacterium]